LKIDYAFRRPVAPIAIHELVRSVTREPFSLERLSDSRTFIINFTSTPSQTELKQLQTLAKALDKSDEDWREEFNSAETIDEQAKSFRERLRVVAQRLNLK